MALPFPHCSASTSICIWYHGTLLAHTIAATAYTVGGLTHTNLSSPLGLPTYSAGIKTNTASFGFLLRATVPGCVAPHGRRLCRRKQGPGVAGKGRDFPPTLSKSLDYLTRLAGLRRGQETGGGPVPSITLRPPQSKGQWEGKGFLLLGFHSAKSSLSHGHRASLPSLDFFFFFNLFFRVSTTSQSKIASTLITSQTN